MTQSDLIATHSREWLKLIRRDAALLPGMSGAAWDSVRIALSALTALGWRRGRGEEVELDRLPSRLGMAGPVDVPFGCEGYVLPDERVRLIAADLLDSIQRFNANAGGGCFAEGALVFETLCVLGALGRRSEPRRQDGATRFSLENPAEIVALWQLMSRRAVDGGASNPEELRAILEALAATWRMRG